MQKTPPCSILMLYRFVKTTTVFHSGSLIAPHEIKLCDECYHHSVCSHLICHICSFKVQIWPCGCGTKVKWLGDRPLSICSLLKPNCCSSSQCYEESVSDRKWSFTRHLGHKRWTGILPTAGRAHMAAEGTKQRPMSVPGIFLALAIFSESEDLKMVSISFGSSCIKFSTAFCPNLIHIVLLFLFTQKIDVC